MDRNQVQEWLNRYKEAWETQDADLFVTLFTEQCVYRDRPFLEPVPRKEFHAYWCAIARIQQDNHIDIEILGEASENRSIVHWQATYTRRATNERLEGDGIFLLTFARDGRCSDVWEWQHWHPVGTPLEKRPFTWERL